MSMLRLVRPAVRDSALLRTLPRRIHAGAVARPLLTFQSSNVGVFVPATPQTRQFSSEHTFQAETRQLLDIVTNSLYTDKEVFLRELISNASDSLEKLRHLQATGMEISDPDVELEITLTVDTAAKTLTLTDSGVGLTKDEMISLLGTIARSGSKAFVAEAKSKDGASASDKTAAESIIGQFGVGFYSAFMVGNKVEVASRPASAEEPSHVWSSEGAGSYAVDALEGENTPTRGCSITIHLKEDQEEYLEPKRLKEVVKKYSNFVNFPIKLEGEVVNTVQALWTKMPSEVTEEEYLAFYKFQTGSFDDPAYRVHFRADVPLDLKVLLFIPSFHTEKWGGGHMDPGVSLYSRKVLIEKDSPDLLPDWMRFVKGVVDSEDLPLAISREKPQDSRLLKRIQTALVKRVLKFLNEKAIKEPEAYRAWFAEFGFFLKEGVCRDFANQADIAKLLYFESSTMKEGDLTSLDEYISRCTPEQDQIFFLCAPSRKLAEESPYYETFKAHNREVLFVYNAIDDFVMSNLATYSKRKIVSAEGRDIDLSDSTDKKDSEDKDAKEGDSASASELSEDDVKDLGDWMVKTMPTKLATVRATSRLASSPAIITEHESGSLRRMMRMVEQQNTGVASTDLIPPQSLEINPKHTLMVGLERLRKAEAADSSSADAELILGQIVDNALVTAGLMDDSRGMVTRVNALMLRLLEK